MNEPIEPVGLDFFRERCPASVNIVDEGFVQCVGCADHTGFHTAWLRGQAYCGHYYEWSDEHPAIHDAVKLIPDGVRVRPRRKV